MLTQNERNESDGSHSQVASARQFPVFCLPSYYITVSLNNTKFKEDSIL